MNKIMKNQKFFWVLCLFCNLQWIFAQGSQTNDLLLIGSYAPSDVEGVALYQLNQETAEVKRISGLKGILNPSYLMPRAEKGVVYVVGEGDAVNNSTVHTVALDPKSGKMELLDSFDTKGASPCHVRISPEGKHIITANYTSGSLSVFSLDEKGHIANREQVLQFPGKGINKARQERAHLHFSFFSPDGKYMLADDLGTDKVYAFPVNAKKSLVDMNKRIENKVTPGSGPRHFCFHPNGKWGYLINELSGAVMFFHYNEGKLEMIQSIQADKTGAEGSADIHLSPDGRFLYSSNRLQNDGIAIFAVSQTDGKLTKVAYQLTGRHPRNFMITKNGKYMFVACRDENEVQIFTRNQENGKLTDTGRRIKMAKPVCVRIYE